MPARLVAKTTAMNTILLATDGSPSAKAATAVAVELAAATGWDLRVLTAWHMPIDPFGYTTMYTPELQDAARDHAVAAADAAVAVAADGDISASADVREGDAVTAICDAARETDVRVVVVGAHGWGALRRLVFGSVSTAVLHHADCPVLVVRADEAALGEAGRADAPAA